MPFLRFNPCRVFKSAATGHMLGKEKIFKKVSIPVGFSSPLQLGAFRQINKLKESFNPCRVFKSAATKYPYLKSLPSMWFQSLSGFQVRCNVQRMTFLSPGSWFQSLSGFQVRCNEILITVIGNASTKFQSLSGFQVRCNTESESGTGPIYNGFNPCRVFKSAATSRGGNAQP